MVQLLGGKAEELKAKTASRHPDVEFVYSDSPERRRSKEQYKAMQGALRPLVVENMIPLFASGAFSQYGNTPRDDIRASNGWKIRHSYSLKYLMGKESESEKKRREKKPPQSAGSQFASLIRHYESIGVNDYSWRLFGPDTRNAEWHYHSFDPPEKIARNVTGRYREITFPKGMEKWYAPSFDPAKAGWRVGKAPFGQCDGKLAPIWKPKAHRTECYMERCGCTRVPSTLWEHEVLLMRRTFKLPPFKEGHFYRVMLGGAGCDRTGEGFAIYLNGKLLTVQKSGFLRHCGIRGAFILNDLQPELKKGTVEVAVINFLRTVYFSGKVEYAGKAVPTNGQVTLWFEHAKIPEPVLRAAGEK
jgi:hypothetical protein